jgi:hypothetical protein
VVRKPDKPSPTPTPPPLRAQGARWIMLMPNLPGPATTKRVRLWRRLQGIGAIAVRPAVYVLPAREECIETFQWVAREIAEMGGQASLCEGQFVDGVTDDDIERKFIEARNADYAALGKEARELAKALKAKRSATGLETLELQLSKLKQRFEEIVSVDFCHASGREGAEGLIGAIERTLADKRGPERKPDRLERSPRPRGATWVTRTGVHVDRLACAWLIRRFIDADAKLKFVAAKGYVPIKGELRFDMYDAEFTHVGDRCSFEVLLERMGIEDPALAPMAEIIHDIDLRDEKFSREETAGVRSQITGLCAKHRDDLERIAAATPLFEALYSFFSLRSRRSKEGAES